MSRPFPCFPGNGGQCVLVPTKPPIDPNTRHTLCIGVGKGQKVSRLELDFLLPSHIFGRVSKQKAD